MHSHNRRYWLRTGSLNLFLNVQTLVFGFGTFFLLVRILDKHSFGIWALYVTTIVTLEAARTGLLQSALIKFLSSSSKENYSEILSASFLIDVMLTVTCIILTLCCAGYLARIWHYDGFVQMFLVYNIVFIFQSVLSQFQWIEQSHLSFNGTVITNVIRQGSFFFYILFCFVTHVGLSLMDLVYAQILSVFVAMVIQYFIIKKYLSFTFNLKRDWVMKLFNFGKYALGTSLSTILSGSISQMMLGAMVSPDAAGVYSVALRITNVADIPTNAIGAIVFPQSSKRIAEQGLSAGKYMYEKSVGTILAILIPGLILLFIFSHFAIVLMASDKYDDAIPIVKITIFTCIMNPFLRMFGTILDSMGKPRLNFIVMLLSTTVNLSLTYFFIGEFKILGVVYVTLITDLILFFVMQMIMWKQLRINFLNSFIYAVRFYPEFFSTYVKPVFNRKMI